MCVEFFAYVYYIALTIEKYTLDTICLFQDRALDFDCIGCIPLALDVCR